MPRIYRGEDRGAPATYRSDGTPDTNTGKTMDEVLNMDNVQDMDTLQETTP